ncbi:uncharacterized protein METZ01_LOCUS93005, partial [marine metagenome]
VLRQDLTQWFQHVGVLKDLSPRHVQPFAVEDSITIKQQVEIELSRVQLLTGAHTALFGFDTTQG